jgi:hypothetical protein
MREQRQHRKRRDEVALGRVRTCAEPANQRFDDRGPDERADQDQQQHHRHRVEREGEVRTAGTRRRHCTMPDEQREQRHHGDHERLGLRGARGVEALCVRLEGRRSLAELRLDHRLG